MCTSANITNAHRSIVYVIRNDVTLNDVIAEDCLTICGDGGLDQRIFVKGELKNIKNKSSITHTLV